MSRRSLMNLAFIMVLAFSGCGRGSEETGTGAGRGTALSDEALIDIMAHSTFLSINLEEYYSEDPDGAVEEFDRRLKEVAGAYGVTLEELQDDIYQEQWERIISDFDLSEEYQERVAELMVEEL